MEEEVQKNDEETSQKPNLDVSRQKLESLVNLYKKTYYHNNFYIFASL